MLAATDFFAISNYCEAALWIVMAAVVCIRASGWRFRWQMAFLLVAFGISDLVEVQTGAWWRPWWLLIWKGVCVIAMLAMLIIARRTRADKATRTTPLPSQSQG